MKLFSILIITLGLFLSGCLKDEKPTRQAEKEDPSPGSTVVEKAETSFSLLDLCRLLPDQEVAAALDGKVLKPGRRHDYGSSQSCEYELDPDGPDNYGNAAVWLLPANVFDDSGATEMLEGLGDRAYLEENKQEQQSSVHILVAGKAAIETKAETNDHALRLAKMAVERLRGRF